MINNMRNYYYSEEHGRLNADYMYRMFGIDTHEKALGKGFVPLDLTFPSYDRNKQYIIDKGTIVENGMARVDWEINDFPRERILQNYRPIVEEMLDKYFDRVARGKGYDSRITCSLRAGFDGPFKSEGVAFASWMDNCYVIVNTLFNNLINDPSIPLPNSVQDIMNMLPSPPWEPEPERTDFGFPPRP